MIKLVSRFFVLALIMLIAACGRQSRHVDRSIYYWKTVFTTKDIDNRLRQAGCKHIYLHCFDVVWSKETGKPMPVAKVRFTSGIDNKLNITPVVFITQDVVRNIEPKDIAQLAANINTLLSQIFAGTGFQANEVQLDCDWTTTSRSNYFALLEAVKRQDFFIGKELSCTIRLHQVKYIMSSGIPPVDKGLVMCYNVGNLKKPGAHNSILEPALAKDYLKDMGSYPLKLDIALPLFSWCVQFDKNGFKGILRDVRPDKIRESAIFFPVDDVLFRCKTDTVWNGYSFLKGDMIRVEEPSYNDIISVAKFTGKQLKNDSLSVVLFHADSLTLSKYSDNEIEAIYSAYH